MQKVFVIDGMSCGHCVMAVKKALSKLNVSASEVEIGKAVVNFDESVVSIDEIKANIEDAGYPVKEIK